MIKAKDEALAPFASAIMEAAASLGLRVVLVADGRAVDRRFIGVEAVPFQTFDLGVRIGRIARDRPDVQAAKERAGRTFMLTHDGVDYTYWSGLEGIDCPDGGR
ncbi:MAG TPA: hypothetical protein VK630_04265 [Reyranella sp.]|nr:hypothetical protein [Reyranella sp.]